MTDEPHTVLSWGRDIALAYAGGLVLGAPVAVVASWASGVERLSTLVLLATMAIVLVALRRAPARRGRLRASAAGGAVTSPRGVADRAA